MQVELVSHFKEIYEHHTEEETEIEVAIPETIEETPNNIEITIYDISSTVEKLINRKAPGIDNICNEMIKYGGRPIKEELIKLF